MKSLGAERRDIDNAKGAALLITDSQGQKAIDSSTLPDGSVPDSFPKDFKPLTMGKVSNAGTFQVSHGHYGWEMLQNSKGGIYVPSSGSYTLGDIDSDGVIESKDGWTIDVSNGEGLPN